MTIETLQKSITKLASIGSFARQRARLERLLIEGRREYRKRTLTDSLYTVDQVFSTQTDEKSCEVRFLFNECAPIAGDIKIRPGRTEGSWDVELAAVLCTGEIVMHRERTIPSSRLFDELIAAINYGLCAGRVNDNKLMRLSA